MNQGPQGYRLTKKTEGRKSHETVPLNSGMLESILIEFLLFVSFFLPKEKVPSLTDEPQRKEKDKDNSA
jgi:hypothetical protein